ncbi:MAG: response regulator transcription factor [Bacteroidales bacterium]|jgi:DNA-binding response OmpR family regulator|nr:response regulator transcription factor [Bacteroidales bacterium]
MAQKILIVDDDPVIGEVLEYNLAGEGFQVTCAHSAEEALKKLTSSHALILLDVMMSGMSGYKLAEKLRREKNQIPIIFLTAKDTEDNMLEGFSAGGDDYISKPFSVKEVVARVKAVLKRQPSAEPSLLVAGELTIDFRLKELIIGSEKIILTKTEFELLSFLAENPQRIFSREDIIEKVWKDTPFITERTVDVHITRLRKKLGKHAPMITSRPGFGYRFNILEE